MKNIRMRLKSWALVLGVLVGFAPVTQADPLPTQYMFGTLITQQGKAGLEYAAGVRVAQEDVFWRYMQKTDGGWDDQSWANKKNELNAVMNAGLKVSLGLGLQYAPDWVFDYPNSRYVNQNGRTAPADVVNFTFNSVMRLKAQTYMDRVFQEWENSAPGRSINDFWTIRVGSGPYVEVFYPGMNDGQGQTNSYWAYDANTSGSSTDRPSSIEACPYPNWKPGNTTEYSGGPAMTQAKVKSWFAWYMAAQMDAVNWQIGYLRNKGYTGFIQVLMPGVGTRPGDFNSATANYLNGTGDSNKTLGRAAVWNQVVDGIAVSASNPASKIVISVTDLGGGSGGNDWTQPGDSSLVIGSDDSLFQSWSSARWISYNANRRGFLKNAETTGRDEQQTTAVLDAAVAQMKGCQMQGMQWAHSEDLYIATSTSIGSATKVTLDEYRKRIENTNGVTREAEDLTIATSSGDVSALVTDAAMSGGKGISYASNAVNDYVTFKANVPYARTYKVMVRVKQFSSRGQCQLAISPSLTGTYTNYGSALDLYSSNGLGVYTELDAGNVTFSASGDQFFRFKVTGKNAASSGYGLVIDSIRLVGQ